MAKNVITSTTVSTSGDPMTSGNYIQQINAGGTVYDIAVHHGVRFYAGDADTTGTLWNGTTDLEVVIPSIADLVTNPIRLAGTVGTSGTAYTVGEDKVAVIKSGYTAEKGDLVFIANDCTFNGVACEAGDMAVYDGTSWTVVSGENQVTINGIGNDNTKTFSLTGTAQEVLTVEGKTLALKIDYSDLNNKLEITKNTEDVELSVMDGVVKVSGVYLSLSKADDATQDISETVSIDLPTALADGTVSIDNVLQASDFTFTSGSYPTLKKNASTIDVTATTSINISKDTTGTDYVASIDGAIKSASIAASEASTTGAIKFVAGISAADGTSFVSGIHTAKSDEEVAGTVAADLVIPGQDSLSGVTTFVSGITSTEASTGDFVSSIEVGAVTVDTSASSFLSGLTDGSDVITSVSFGDVAQDNTREWFYSSIGDASTSGDFVSSVSVGAVSIEEDSSSSYGTDAVVSATVSNNVLVISTGTVMKPVKINQATTAVSFKSLSKTGIKLSGQTVTSKGFATAGIAQASTAVSFKSFENGTVTLTPGTATSYWFDKTASKTYSTVDNYLTLSTTAATISTASPTLTGTTISAYIPTNSVAVDYNTDAVLPSLTIGDATGTISGTVDTALSTTKTSWLGIADDYKSVTTAGSYTLVSSSTDNSGILVAVSGDYTVSSATVTIASDTFVTDVDFTTDTSAE